MCEQFKSIRNTKNRKYEELAKLEKYLYVQFKSISNTKNRENEERDFMKIPLFIIEVSINLEHHTTESEFMKEIWSFGYICLYKLVCAIIKYS